MVCECSNIYSIGSPLNAKATLLRFGLKTEWKKIVRVSNKFLAFPQESILDAATPPFSPTTNLSPRTIKKKLKLHLACELKRNFVLNNFVPCSPLLHNNTILWMIRLSASSKNKEIYYMSVYISPKIGPLFNI